MSVISKSAADSPRVGARASRCRMSYAPCITKEEIPIPGARSCIAAEENKRPDRAGRLQMKRRVRYPSWRRWN